MPAFIVANISWFTVMPNKMRLTLSNLVGGVLRVGDDGKDDESLPGLR